MKLRLKAVSSLTKVMPDETVPAERPLAAACVLRGEVFSFQVAYYAEKHYPGLQCRVASPLGDAVTLRQVGLVPAQLLHWEFDDNIITRHPGLFPDPLLPLPATLTAFPHQWRSVWVTVKLPEDCPAGVYPITVTMTNEKEEIDVAATVTLEVLPAALPPQRMIRTEWIYADCLAVLYHTEVWSERHWELLAQYFRNMVEHGITQVLTPLFTVPLDTEVGGERPTAQLVEVACDRGRFRFDFARLDRWVELARNCGLRQFEFSHLYTQWGAKHAPKIMVRRDGGAPERMFGWDTDAMGDDYQSFLAVFLDELVAYIDRRGLRDCCCFHISDEPDLTMLEDYRRAGAIIRTRLAGFRVVDAMSHLEFYREKLCLNPIPCLEALEDFVAAGVPELWTYYCCNPATGSSNRFFHYSGERTRVLGFQLYRYDIRGFLHWGYNFWFARWSKGVIDPFTCPDAGAQFPAGDAFLVYPGADGPVDSLRHELMREALQDQRAMQLLESRIGRDAALAFLQESAGGELSVMSYPQSPEALFNLRQVVNRRIIAAG
ncbi:MAG: DUF4091 domain-containing protein [Victivallales bacterium]|nr:DUF4091 domain-containing protein [Victivallales bacterium]